jgi:hypothetical protein
MPTVLAGAPLPFKIVLGIDVALLPAASAGRDVSTEEISARETKVAIRLRFTGDLQVVGM